MAQTTLNANRSVFIDADSATTNFDSAPQIDIGESALGTERRRGLIGFDLSTLSGATITAVTFQIYDADAETLGTNARTVDIFRLKRVWVENQATWNVYSTGNSWETAGGSGANDKDGTASGSFSATEPSTVGYKTASLTVADIQAWVDGTFTNNGLILMNNGTETDDMHRYNGSGDSNPPQLVITYTPAASSSMLLSF